MAKTTVYSANDPILRDPASAPRGITYFLPRRRLKLVVQRQPASEADSRKARDAAADAVKSAKKKAGESKAKAARDRAIEKQARGLAKEAAERQALLSEAELAVAQAEQSIAQQQLEEAELNLKLVRQGGAYLDKLTLDLLPPEPDPSRVFVARLDHSFQREDDLKVSTTEAGLLKSVTAETTDRTPDAFVELAKTLVQVAKLVSGVPSVGSRGVVRGPTTGPEFFTFERTFDPQTHEADEINQKLIALGTKYQVRVVPTPTPTSTPTSSRAPSSSLPAETPVEIAGFVYPRAIPYRIEIETEADGGSVAYAVKALDVLLPNGGPLAVLAFDSGAAVTNTYGAEFVDGILVKRDEKRPSELLGVVKILPTIAKEIVSIPTELIQFKIDYSSKEEALLKAQKAVLDAQKELDKAMQPTPTPAP